MQFSSSYDDVHDFLFDSLVIVIGFHADLFETGPLYVNSFDVHANLLRHNGSSIVQPPG
jgi:hypothetical protein